jgi:hypothetical protein
VTEDGDGIYTDAMPGLPNGKVQSASGEISFASDNHWRYLCPSK